MTPKFSIGEAVYIGEYSRFERFVTCPDCGGSKKIKVTLADATEWMIECGACDPGGYIAQYDWTAQCKSHSITGVKVTKTQIEYEMDKPLYGGSYFTGNETNIFATEAEAIAYSEAQKNELAADENKRLMAKTKDHKTWAWNLSYHRKCAKNAERDWQYHLSKVEICLPHVSSKSQYARLVAQGANVLPPTPGEKNDD